MRILVTGAAGKVGSAAVEHLLGVGEEVVATDVVHRPGLAAPLRVADLLDEPAVYGLVEGVDAVLHLGNHPNCHVPVSRQRLLSENVRMTANVLWAAVGVGVRRVVYASSIQVLMNLPAQQPWGRAPEPCPFPRLPADGRLPTRTGVNPYAMSKAHGESLLRELCGVHEDLAGVALRLPHVRPSGWWERRGRGGRGGAGAAAAAEPHALRGPRRVGDARRVPALRGRVAAVAPRLPVPLPGGVHGGGGDEPPPRSPPGPSPTSR